MDAAGVWALALAVTGLALVHLVKGPKEYHGETVKRVDKLETRHQELSDKFVDANGRTIVAMNNLSDSVRDLTAQVRALGQQVQSLARRR